jgi:nucleoside phosphorylase
MPPLKKQKASPPIKKSEEFSVAIVYPLKVKALAMIQQLNKNKDYGKGFSNNYHFTLGSIGEHNIVVMFLPAGRQGNTSATIATQQTMAKFTRITCMLLAGIAGVVPSDKHDIRLGDVVVSFPHGKYGGVVHYDFGRTKSNSSIAGR